MNFICPTLGENHEKDFLVMGSLDDFKIIVFSDMENYNKGFEYLELTDYNPVKYPLNYSKNFRKMMMSFQVLFWIFILKTK